MDERRLSGLLVEGDRHVADATGAEQTVRLQTDMALGIEETRSGRGTPLTR